MFHEDGDENNINTYVNWTVSDSWVLGVEFLYDWFRRSDDLINIDRPRPRESETISVPVSLRYFGQSGVFAGVSGTVVN